MKISIKENQLLKLREGFQNSFSFETLSSIGGSGNIEEDNNARYEYCVKHLGEPVGEGSSRVVFTLTDGHILKLARKNSCTVAYITDGVGEEQNKQEYEIYKEMNTPILPKILYCDRNYYYMVCESVLPAKKEDFEKILGIPFNLFYAQNSEKVTDENSPNKGDVTIGFNKYFDGSKEGVKYAEGVTIMDVLEYFEANYVDESEYYDEEIENVIKSCEWLQELEEFIMNSDVTDFASLGNFGIVNRDGNPYIVLLDTGLNLDIWENGYWTNAYDDLQDKEKDYQSSNISY